jgi:hypothetical protein
LKLILFLQTKEDMLRWIARCLLLHGVAPCELMGDTERSLHISLLFDLPWQADLAALATPTSPAVMSGGTSLGKWNLSICLGGGKLAYSPLLGMSYFCEGSPQSSMTWYFSLNN